MHSFTRLADRLSKDYKVITLDFFGFGDTPSPDYPLTLMDYVDGVKEVIERYHLSNVTLVGHSFGGRVAMLFSVTYPDMVDSLVLIDSAGLRPRRGLDYYARVWFNRVLRRLGLNGLRGSKDYQNLTDVEKQTFKNVVNLDLTPLLTSITQKTLILWGGKDKDTPLYMGKKLKKYIKNSDLVVFCKAGHFSYLDESNATYHVIKYFLAQC